jgi:putative acetyltransferase
MPQDYATVEDLTEQAFGQTAEAEVVRRIRHQSDLHPLSLVAVQDQTIIGHVLCSKITLTGAKTSDPLFGLGPVSVHPDHQRQGIGSALIREGLSMCESSGGLACFVLGNPTYYQRFGFQNAYKAGFWYKKDEDNRAFQVIFWDNADQHLPQSEVRYAEAFSLAN